MMRSPLPLLPLCLALLLHASAAAAAAPMQSSSFEVVHVSSPTLSSHLSRIGAHTQSSSSAGQQVPHPAVHRLSFRAGGEELTLTLRRNEDLFAPGYSETRMYFDEAGRRRPELESNPRPRAEVEHCFYLGSSEPEGGATAALNTCDGGFSGMVRTKKDVYVIAPAHQHLNGAQLRAHVQALRSSAASADGGDSSVSKHSLHVVYPLRSTREFQLLSSLGGGSGGGHVCGVDHPSVRQTAVPIESGASDKHATAPAHMPQSHTEQLDHHAHHNDVLHAFLGVDLEREEEEILAAKRQGKSSASAAASRLRPSFRLQAIPSQRYVELFVANDRARYSALGQSTEQRSANIVNIINGLYTSSTLSPSLQVVLVGQATFFVRDPYNVTMGPSSSCPDPTQNEVCVDELLSLWNEWRRNPDNTAPYQNNDAGHLFSGIDFQSVVLGYAGVGAMCITAQSGGINQMTSADDTFNGVIAAHEIGHNLGMQHDSKGNTCPESGFIMNAVVNSGTPPSQFSSCSVSYYNSWTQNGAGSCLDNVPTQRYGDPVCGNGYVEAGEQCDCGPYPPGVDWRTVDPNFCAANGNPCCDPFSCQLNVGAVCSESDACCTNCQVTSASENKTCRASTGGCDVAEVCDGRSSACPVDDFVGNGASCSDATYGSGACFEGRCQSFALQCGDVSKVFSGGPWEPCPVAQQLNKQNGREYCNTLYCSTHGDATTCSYFDFSGANSEQMADGNPCGPTTADGTPSPSSLCYKGKCVPAGLTNTRHEWRVSGWEKCSDCNTFQSRNVSCVRVANGEAAADIYCSADSRPASSQACSDEELLCDHGLGGVVEFTLLDYHIVIDSKLVMGVAGGVFAFLLLVMHLCVMCVGAREAERKQQPQPVSSNQVASPTARAGRSSRSPQPTVAAAQPHNPSAFHNVALGMPPASPRR